MYNVNIKSCIIKDTFSVNNKIIKLEKRENTIYLLPRQRRKFNFFSQ